MFLDGRVRGRLAAETRFTDIRLLEETGSTNDLVVGLAEAGAPEGLVVAADHQTAGRGRLDRTWEARPGDGLLVSVLLRPDLSPERYGLAPSAVAVAARQACAEVAGVEAEIKWPNDLLADGQKLAGILAASSGGTVVVGMGLNVHGAPPGAACLDERAGRRVGREDLLVAWLLALEPLVADWDSVAGRYAAECGTVGRDVSVQTAVGGVLAGRAESVDPLGRLVVRPAGGEPTVFAVGDVTHLR